MPPSQPQCQSFTPSQPQCQSFTPSQHHTHIHPPVGGVAQLCCGVGVGVGVASQAFHPQPHSTHTAHPQPHSSANSAPILLLCTPNPQLRPPTASILASTHGSPNTAVPALRCPSWAFGEPSWTCYTPLTTHHSSPGVTVSILGIRRAKLDVLHATDHPSQQSRRYGVLPGHSASQAGRATRH